MFPMKIVLLITVYIQIVTAADGNEKTCSDRSCGDQVQRPNIVLIIADDLGYGEITVWPNYISEHLNR
jgi:hypothetical protein